MQDPPTVYLPRFGHGAFLLAWIHRPDGWWAHLSCVTICPGLGRSYRDEFAEWELYAHESLVQPRRDVVYDRVPRVTPD